MNDKYVIGIDYGYGTDPVRSVLVNAINGKEICHSVFDYPRWKAGKYCNPSNNQFRQHPLDHLEGLESTIKDCIQKSGTDIAENIIGISVDTTGSSPVAVDKHRTSLALLPEFADNPNAASVKDAPIKKHVEENTHKILITDN